MSRAHPHPLQDRNPRNTPLDFLLGSEDKTTGGVPPKMTEFSDLDLLVAFSMALRVAQLSDLLSRSEQAWA